MKILFAIFVLFATQTIPLRAHIRLNRDNALITGFEKPQIKFWNPFSKEKGMIEFQFFVVGEAGAGLGGHSTVDVYNTDEPLPLFEKLVTVL